MFPEFPHAQEVIELIPKEARLCADLWPILEDVGFTQQRGVWFLPREDEIPNGQSESNGTISIFFEAEELYLDKEDELEDDDDDEELEWDRIEIQYLLATLPEERIKFFLRAISSLSNALRLPLRYQHQEITVDELEEKFSVFCQELNEEYGGAGSKTIRHFIDLHYSS